MYKVGHPSVLMDKTLICMIISLALHQTVLGESPASPDGQNINLRDYFSCISSNRLKWVTRQLWRTKHQFPLLYLLCYIELYEVGHPPVLLDKTLIFVIICLVLHKTVWGESPVSSDGQNINLHDYFTRFYQTVWGESPASSDGQTLIYMIISLGFIKLF